MLPSNHLDNEEIFNKTFSSFQTGIGNLIIENVAFASGEPETGSEPTMKVQDLMQTEITTAAADQLIADAIVTLADAGVHGLPVVDTTSKKLVGVISTTDILEAISEHEGAQTQRFLETTTVEEMMTRKVTTIAPDAEITEAAQLMLYRDIHRLFVELNGKLVGVISQSDIVRAVGTAKI